MGFKTFIVLLVLLLGGLFAYIKVQTLGSPQSTFNQTTRFTLGRHPNLRTIFSLHSAGDAREEYLTGTDDLLIEISEAPGTQLDQSALDDFAAKVGKYIGRPTKVYDVDEVANGNLSSSDIASYISVDKRNFEPGAPILYIIYADDFDNSIPGPAMTFGESGIVLSDQRLKSLTASDSETLPQYQESALLHEFGYQMGLSLNQDQTCVMSAAVENPRAASTFSAAYIPIDFCPAELSELQQIQMSLH